MENESSSQKFAEKNYKPIVFPSIIVHTTSLDCLEAREMLVGQL